MAHTQEYMRAWRAANLAKARGYEAKYRAANRGAVKARILRWQKANWEHVLEYHRQWRAKHPQKVLDASQRWRRANPDTLKNACRNWNANNREHINQRERNRCATDPCYKLSRRLRQRLRQCVRRDSAKKSKSALALVGCSADELRHHLESQFADEMNWQNYGVLWEIDHKQPCISFDMTDPRQQSACFHYSNLQPLLVSENRKKHSKIL